MTDETMRLECIKVAARIMPATSTSNGLALAKSLVEWCKGKDVGLAVDCLQSVVSMSMGAKSHEPVLRHAEGLYNFATNKVPEPVKAAPPAIAPAPKKAHRKKRASRGTRRQGEGGRPGNKPTSE